MLEDHLADREFFAGGFSIADVSLYAYVHRAEDAGLDLDAFPGVSGWLQRVGARPGFVNDLVPYPPSSFAGASRSIYDA